MNSLNLEATISTPHIQFEPETGVLLISGESYPENSFEFYAPILAWLKETLLQVSDFKLKINVSYMNSSSVKCLLDIVDLLEEAGAEGVNIEIFWYYDSANPRSLDLAEDFQEEITLPFSIIPLTTES